MTQRIHSKKKIFTILKRSSELSQKSNPFSTAAGAAAASSQPSGQTELAWSKRYFGHDGALEEILRSENDDMLNLWLVEYEKQLHRSNAWFKNRVDRLMVYYEALTSEFALLPPDTPPNDHIVQLFTACCRSAVRLQRFAASSVAAAVAAARNARPLFLRRHLAARLPTLDELLSSSIGADTRPDAVLAACTALSERHTALAHALATAHCPEPGPAAPPAPVAAPRAPARRPLLAATRRARAAEGRGLVRRGLAGPGFNGLLAALVLPLLVISVCVAGMRVGVGAEEGVVGATTGAGMVVGVLAFSANLVIGIFAVGQAVSGLRGIGCNFVSVLRLPLPAVPSPTACSRAALAAAAPLVISSVISLSSIAKLSIFAPSGTPVLSWAVAGAVLGFGGVVVAAVAARPLVRWLVTPIGHLVTLPFRAAVAAVHKRHKQQRREAKASTTDVVSSIKLFKHSVRGLSPRSMLPTLIIGQAAVGMIPAITTTARALAKIILHIETLAPSWNPSSPLPPAPPAVAVTVVSLALYPTISATLAAVGLARSARRRLVRLGRAGGAAAGGVPGWTRPQLETGRRRSRTLLVHCSVLAAGLICTLGLQVLVIVNEVLDGRIKKVVFGVGVGASVIEMIATIVLVVPRAFRSSKSRRTRALYYFRALFLALAGAAAAAVAACARILEIQMLTACLPAQLLSPTIISGFLPALATTLSGARFGFWVHLINSYSGSFNLSRDELTNLYVIDV